MVEKVKMIKDYTVHLKVGTVAIITATCITTLIGVGVCYEKIQSKLSHLDGKTELYQQQFDALENRVDTNEKSYIEIKTKLANIEVMILEIKQKLDR